MVGLVGLDLFLKNLIRSEFLSTGPLTFVPNISMVFIACQQQSCLSKVKLVSVFEDVCEVAVFNLLADQFCNGLYERLAI